MGAFARSVRGSTLVIADDDPMSRDLLVEILRSQGYAVEAFEDGQQAIERVARGNVDLVLLDVVMPRLGGMEACRLLKGMTSDGFLPVVLVTVKTDTRSRLEGLSMGADDYVCKPYDQGELLARVEALLRIKKLSDHVAQARAKLEQLSVRDPLTGLYNYRYLHGRLSDEIRHAERHHHPVGCLVLDIDRLQAINDAGGRRAGDAALCSVAEAAVECVRSADVVSRFGGDELLVVLPGTHFAGSVAIAEQIWRRVRSGERTEETAAGLLLSVSIGVALFPSRDIRTKEELLRSADAALQQAKRDGGDRVCVFQQRGYLYTPSAGSNPFVERRRAPSNPRNAYGVEESSMGGHAGGPDAGKTPSGRRGSE
jgi:diguanylate cyclase (GGDEF)-like protein